MKYLALPLLCTILAAPGLSFASNNHSQSCATSRYEHRRRLFVLTDIENEPDDQMSLVRLLTYSNEIDIRGIAAVTSTYQTDKVFPQTITGVIGKYGQVVENLNHHVHPVAQYPPSKELLQVVSAGHPVLGLEALTLDLSEAATRLIEEVQASQVHDPLWVAGWGGMNVLAEALHHVSQTKDKNATEHFVSKLRVYGISDQDDAGFWIRQNYPSLFFIVSQHGWQEFQAATWVGFSGENVWRFDERGPDSSIVTNDWLQQHIRLGVLGAQYPNFTVVMEGDTPSFLPLIRNGLAEPDHPEWGSWGGRYSKVGLSDKNNIYSNAADLIEGNETFISDKATIWRWREAYQNDFAARMQWTLNKTFENANHEPVAVVNASCGPDPFIAQFTLNDTVILDASGSWDPDGDKLEYQWFHYADINIPMVVATSGQGPWATMKSLNEDNSIVAVTPRFGQEYHIILVVKDTYALRLTAYRRVILQSSDGVKSIF